MSYSSRRETWNWIILLAVVAAAAWLLSGCAVLNINLGSGTLNSIPVVKVQRGNSALSLGASQANPTASNTVTVPLGGLLP
jgi:hypothetical protein